MFGGVGRKSVAEESIEKSLGDSLFKLLEDALDSLQVLSDISQELQTNEGFEAVRSQLTPGAVVRVTAPARLFHPGQLSHAMVGIGTAATGMYDLQNSFTTPEPTLPTPGKNRQQSGKGPRKSRAKPLPETGAPEDILFGLPDDIPMVGPRDFLVGMIRFVRGIFSDGVHVHFHPLGDSGPVITTRLETGRRFLDSTPEILFSRYGFRPQEWTVVGTVGHLGELDTDKPDFGFLSDFNRSSIVQLVAALLQQAGNSGLIDLPSGLGFSVVPLAVYRAIGWGGETPTMPSQAPSAIEPAR